MTELTQELQEQEYSRLRERVRSGKCVLFLGAGATAIAKGPTASKLTKDLSESLALPAPAESLGELAEFCDTAVARGRARLTMEIIERLRKLSPSPFHQLIPRFPWNAIITTNYDDLIEISYDDAIPVGMACRKYRRVVRTKDLLEIPEATVPVIKAHGCVTDPERAPLTLTFRDYYDLAKNRRPLFERIKILFSEATVLFVGYSLNDYNFNNLLFEIEDELKESGQPHYFVTLLGGDEGRFKLLEAILRGKGISIFSYDPTELLERLAEDLRELVLQHRLVPQFELLDIDAFAGCGRTSFKIIESDATEPLRLHIEFSVSHDVQQSFAGVFLEKRDGAFESSRYKEVEISYRFMALPDYTTGEVDSHIEFKLEGRDRRAGGEMEVRSDIYYLPVEPNEEFKHKRIPLSSFGQLHGGKVRRVTLAANKTLLPKDCSTVTIEIESVKFF